MKTTKDIENVEVRKEIEDLLVIFEDSFINDKLEFIAILYYVDDDCNKEFANLYFNIKVDCNSSLDVKCKVLEWFSRDCYKAKISNKSYVNNNYHNYVLQMVNQYLHTNFTQEDMELIYTKIGNGIRRKLCVEFINSGYNLEILKNE